MRLTKELYWITGLFVLTLIIGLITFGRGLWDGKPLDVQLHDTYFVFTKAFFLTLIFIAITTIAYLVRGIYLKLNNRAINIILTVLFFVIVCGLAAYLYWMDGFEDQMRILASKMDATHQSHVSTQIKTVKGVLWSLIIITVSLSATTGYKSLKRETINK